MPDGLYHEKRNRARQNESVGNQRSKKHKMSTTTMSNLKQHVLNYKTKVFMSNQVADPKHLGIHLLAKAIPSMDNGKEVAFAWHWAMKDVTIYTKQEYETETSMYKNTHKMKKTNGDTTWFYDFKKDGKMRRCIMTTEIWYKPNTEHNVSPIAILMGQFMANGFHITKCVFQDAE